MLLSTENRTGDKTNRLNSDVLQYFITLDFIS